MDRRTRAWLTRFAIFTLLVPAIARSDAPTARPGELLVRYRAGVRATERFSARPENGITLVRRFARFDIDLVRIEGRTTAQAMVQLARDPRVLYAEPNWEYHVDRVPDDFRWDEMWSLLNTGQNSGVAGADIRAPRAWDLFTGDPELKIGMIDTGVDYEHPDIAANIWTNPGEIPDNGVDDDGNGYIDDVHGWDAANEDGDPIDDHGHGTHTAGTVAAVGNNGIGITGVCWRAKIVPIKFLNFRGTGSSAEALESVEYAIAAGVRLTNNSWGGGAYSQALLDAITVAGQHGQLFIASAGNAATDNDRSPAYPASYDSPYIIAVASTDNRDKLSSFSNYGLTSVDLAAPGSSILSLAIGGGYRINSGTSMAAPHVTGVAALAMGLYPLASNLVIRQQLLASVDTLAALAGKVATGGRLNAFLTIAQPDSTAPGRVSDLRILEATSSGFRLAWTATGDDGASGRALHTDLRWSLAPIVTDADFDSAHAATGPQPEPAGTPQEYEVRGLSASTTYWLAMKVLDEFGNAGPLSNQVSDTTLEPPELDLSPASLSEEALVNGEVLRTITLRNVGVGTLDFEIPTPEIAYGATPVFEAIPTPKDAPDTRVGPPVVAGRGGPDEFGYRWIDSREPGGPVFEWLDIRDIGTRINLLGDEASTSALPIGFAFPFYGNTYSLFRVTTNGYLSFTETNSQYDNQPLPSTAAPQSLIAPFWDDLFLGPFSNVYFFSDGTRCIVTWENVSAFPTGGPYTFQLILDPTGEIEFQYLAMNEPLNTATVGIQNVTRLIGLTAAFNADFVQPSLAVKFVPTQQWLTVTPASGRMLPGESQDVTAKLSGFGLAGGTYQASLNVLTNDPDEAVTRIPVDFRVIGAPDLHTVPAELDFGTAFVGHRSTRSLTVTNVGSDRLDITAITPTDGDVTVTPSALTVLPREVKYLTVSCTPTSIHDLTGGLVVTSNDADAPTQTIPITGTCREAPRVQITPDSMAVPIASDQVVHRPLRITNSGGSEFVFTVQAGRAGAPPVTAPVGKPVSTVDRTSNPALDPRNDRTGGPDRFGYTYRASDEPGGPEFEWVDIRNNGIQLPLMGEDGNVGPIPLGFDFPFYGTAFNTFRVCLNGWISFTNMSSGRENFPLPSAITTAPENVIALYWDDLAFGLQRRAWYRNDGTRVIVQFQDVFRSGETSSYGNTFEAFLYPNGTIVLQYLRLNAIDNASHTVGLQNATRDDGLQVAFNEVYLHDSLAVRISPPSQFVSVTQGGGSVPPGGFLDLDVVFDATGLFGGTYFGEIRVAGNDPGIPEQVVRAQLDVTGVPRTAFVSSDVQFGDVFVGFPGVRVVRVINLGTDVLQVSDITIDDPAFQVDRTQFTLAPLASTELFVTLGALEPGGHHATLTLRCNDPDESRTRVTLTGQIVDAPSLEMSTATISGTLAIPDETTRTLTVRNGGGSDLHFSVATLFQLTPGTAPRPQVRAVGASPLPGGDARSGSPVQQGRGGPDEYGYHWRDSDQPGGPEFEWIDIQSIGTPLPLVGAGNDENVREIALGFDFPFYGVLHRTVNVCSNGWLSFTSDNVSSVNQPLPSAASTAPENLLAVFWDDLNPGNTAVRLWTWTDGHRFVISWIGVLRAGSGGPYTFQAVLEPSGRILYQYRAMRGSRLAEATIGIQNGTRDIGLTVANDQEYVRDSLAVEFLPLPEFVRVEPESGIVPAGGSTDLTVSLDSHNLFGATYRGGLQVVTNDPNHERVIVPVELVAHGTPDILSEPQVVAFQPILAGSHADQVVRILNRGTDSLVIRSLSVLHRDPASFAILSLPALPVTVGPRAPLELTVRFAPLGPCDPCTELLVAGCNDPDSALFQVPLVGRGLPPPEIDGVPSGLRALLQPRGGLPTLTRQIVVRNTGGGDLDWSAEAYSMLPGVAPAGPVADEAAGPQEPKGTDGAPGPPTLASAGGPDSFGYRWADSDEPMSAPFAWVDLTTIGVPLLFELDDQTLGPFPLPFSFPFYGQTFDSIRICSNGWLSFTSNRTTYSNVALPSAGAGVPENLIAAFWEDLTYNVDRGSAYWHYDGEKVVFSFHQVRRFGGDAFVTFQVLLYPSGTIDFQYLTMNGRTDNATIGIQNASRSVGLQVAYNTAYVKNNLRTRIAPRGGWLSVTPPSGRIPPGGSDTLQVGFDATAYPDGDYAGLLRIASNDVDEPSVEVRCQLHVGPSGSAAQSTAGIPVGPPLEFGLHLLGGNPVRGDARLELAMPASGAPEVRVFDVRGRVVRRLVTGQRLAGRHVIEWKGDDASGAPAAPGVYFVRATMASEPARVVRVVKLQ